MPPGAGAVPPEDGGWPDPAGGVPAGPGWQGPGAEGGGWAAPDSAAVPPGDPAGAGGWPDPVAGSGPAATGWAAPEAGGWHGPRTGSAGAGWPVPSAGAVPPGGMAEAGGRTGPGTGAAEASWAAPALDAVAPRSDWWVHEPGEVPPGADVGGVTPEGRWARWAGHGSAWAPPAGYWGSSGAGGAGPEPGWHADAGDPGGGHGQQEQVALGEENTGQEPARAGHNPSPGQELQHDDRVAGRNGWPASQPPAAHGDDGRDHAAS